MKSDVIYEINDLLDRFKEKFPSKFQKKWDELIKEYNKENAVNSCGSFQPEDLVSILMFGESKYSENITGKVDYNKNKNTFKQLILNLFGIKGSISLIRFIICDFDETIGEINDKFSDFWRSSSKVPNDDIFITKDEIEHLYEMLDGFSWESTHNRSLCTTLVHIMDTINVHTNTPHLNKDTLKRYYFNNVYELKNSIKLFDDEKMVFGETNNVMRYFNKLFDYVFGDIICIYYTTNNHFKVLTNETSKESSHKRKR